MKKVTVKNNTPDHLVSEFEGVIYEFPPSKEVVVTEEVAQFFFGYTLPLKERLPYARRFGKLDLNEAYRFLKLIEVREKAEEEGSNELDIGKTSQSDEKVTARRLGKVLS